MRNQGTTSSVYLNSDLISISADLAQLRRDFDWALPLTTLAGPLFRPVTDQSRTRNGKHLNSMRPSHQYGMPLQVLLTNLNLNCL